MTVGELINILSDKDKDRTISVYDICEKECYPINKIVFDKTEIDKITRDILENDIMILF